MIHSIYKTTNKINGKFYFGMHTSEDPNDNYLGSGTALKSAINKYGIENFTKEIIKICESREELEHFEELYVGMNIDDPLCYNLKAGGQGGWDHTHVDGAIAELRRSRIKESFKKGISKGWQLTTEQRSELFSGDKNGFAGKTHSKETRAKISAANITDKETEQNRIDLYHAEPKSWGWKARLGIKYGIKPQKVAPWLKKRGLI